MISLQTADSCIKKGETSLPKFTSTKNDQRVLIVRDTTQFSVISDAGSSEEARSVFCALFVRHSKRKLSTSLDDALLFVIAVPGSARPSRGSPK